MKKNLSGLKNLTMLNNLSKNNNQKIKIKRQANVDTTLTLDVGKNKANRYILYWGASKAKGWSIMIHDAKKAYGNFKNHGISKVNKNGLVKLYFNCPQHIALLKKERKTGKHFINIFIFAIQMPTAIDGLILFIQRLLFVNTH